MSVYYNEIDSFAAAWLRELMKAGQIPDGEVDERSIELVQPDDLRGFRQCHFFAGIGGWALALRLAGWPDDRRVWTGSCPCQPWSMAGRGEGANDPRHLWPAWSRLIEQCRPPVVFGEQVASEDGRYWLDLVFHDMEARDYAIGAGDLPACCIGAPHQRQRLWFVAHANSQRCEGQLLHVRERGPLTAGTETAWRGEALCDCGHRADAHDFGADDCNVCSCTYFLRALEHTDSGGAERIARHEGRAQPTPSLGRKDERRGRLQTVNAGIARELGHSDRSRLEKRPDAEIGAGPLRIEGAAVIAAGATRGRWADCDWLWHRDGKYRAVEPGTFPLAARLPGDMERIRCYGNAIAPDLAAVFIEAYLDTCGELR